MKEEKLKFLVVDDEYPARNELHYLLTRYLPKAEIEEADSGQMARELADKFRYDAAFVDMHLGDMEGTLLAAILKEMQPHMKIIFATAFDAYAAKAFDLDALDYILKPFDPQRVEYCIKKITTALEIQPQKAAAAEKVQKPDKLAIVSDKRVILLAADEIAYIESSGRNSIVHASNTEYTTSSSLNHFEKLLPSSVFFRSHKSFLVNLNYISELTPWLNGAFSIKLKGYEQSCLPVSRNQTRALREIFGF